MTIVELAFDIRHNMISCCPSIESLFQVAFAISPFPFYLPQYFSMTKQLSSSDSSDDCSSSDSRTVAPKEPLGAAIDRGGDHYLRKRNPLDVASSTGIGIASPPTSMGIDCMLYGTPSKSFEDETKHPNKLDTGLSRATVLLLLSAHLLRLLHFHGVILQLQSEKQLEGAASEQVNLAKPTAASAAYFQGGTSILQWDLLGQSMSMIAMQLLLLHTMMLVRRKQMKRQMKRMCDGEIAGNNSTDSLPSHTSPMADSVMCGSINATSMETSNHGCNHRNTSPVVSTSQNMPYWRAKRQQCFCLTTDHLHQLLSPHNILESHSFLEYCELLMLVSISVMFMFDYHWFPRYGKKVVDGLKHISIALESCLALPQAIRNHRKGTTEGLSVSHALKDSRYVVTRLFFCSFSLNMSLISDGHGGWMGGWRFLQTVLLFEQYDKGRQQRQYSLCLGLCIFSRVRLCCRGSSGTSSGTDTPGDAGMAETDDEIILALEIEQR